jgi:hypothetical protein
MDYADACLVRLAELHRERVIVTTDVEDFRSYHRFQSMNGRFREQ